MSSKRGFTLLETLIAVALLGVIVVSILSAFSATTIAATRHAQLTALDRLTRSDAEYIKSQAYSTAATYSNLPAAGYTFSYQVKFYDPALKTFTALTDNGLQEIILTVKGPNNASQQLDFLKVEP
ncbi:MAG TPA: type II secretion system protein [Candidatus Dormibacteraeota bacterium]|nr:type II secretion system protein [Candidatus Dormibacteraeota bacterium]